MNNRKTIPALLPYLVALALFITIPMLYFAPQYEGRQLPMHDVTQYVGSSKEIDDHIEQYGEDPQWTGAMFGGMPSYQISMRHPSVIIHKAFRALCFIGDPACFIFLAMLGFFIMLLLWGVNPWVGVVPSLAYGLSSYFLIIIGAGHINKMIALAYAPMMLGAVFYTYRSNLWLGAALTALFASVELAVNHPQITYYFAFVLAAFWINELVLSIREKGLPRFAKATGLLIAAGVLAVGSNLGPLYYTLAHTGETTRGGTELTLSEGAVRKTSGLDLDYVTAWSYGKAETFNLFIPDLMGGASDGGFADDGPVAQALRPYGAAQIATRLPGYWGDQPVTAGPTYIGAVVIFLAVLALFLLPGRNKWWILAVSVLAVFLGWGRHMMWFTELFYHYFPLYDKFRTVAMILVIVQWSAPFLMALLLQKLWNREIGQKELFRGVKWALLVVGGVALFFAAAGGSLFDFGREEAYAMMMQLSGDQPQIAAELTDAIVAERAAMLRGDALRSLLFVVLTAGVVMIYGIGRIKRGWVLAALGVLVCADLIPVDLRYLPQSKFVEPQQAAFRPTEADKQILADPELGFRVMNLTVSPFDDATTSYYHRSVGGYHGAKMQRYQDLIERHLRTMNMPVYNMLNTKYFIQRDPNGQPVAHLNPDAYGPAWFVYDIRWAKGADEEIAFLGNTNTKTTAVVDEQFHHQIDEMYWRAGALRDWLVDGPIDSSALAEVRNMSSKGIPFLSDLSEEQRASFIVRGKGDTIMLKEYRPNRLTYAYQASTPRIAIFSEIYFRDGWTATIDGEPADYFRANYVLRGMSLPAGEHTVVFSFRAPHFRTISAVTLLFSILILACVAAAAAWTILEYRKRKQNDAGQQ